MDEGLDVNIDTCAESATADLPVSESMDTVTEPITDIPVEDSTIESLNEAESSLSGQEMAELHNEAEALEIEPLVEGNNDDYFEIKGENSHSLGERIGAGLLAAGAPFAAGIESASQVQNIEPFGAPTEIRVDSPYEIKTPEQILEEFIEQSNLSKPSPLQTAGELAGNYLDVAEGIAEGQRLRDNTENTGELSTAFRKPEYNEFSEIEKG
jgi:hypothetical protein